ncbi:PEP-CTERM motif protein [Pirellula sp. SH-Sr6A]|nr:PEP-CTERM motif protein [Pirellula sp. SH-Sr6A]
MRSLLFSLVLVGWLQSQAFAEFTFRVGNGTGTSNPIEVLQGGSVIVPIYGYFDTAAEATNLTVGGFSVAFDLGGDGRFVNTNAFVFPDPPPSTTSFSTTGVTLGGGYSSFIEGNPPSTNANWDRRLSATFVSPASFTTTPQRLFDLKFNAGNSVGVFGINIVPNALSPTNATQVSVNTAPYVFRVEQGSFQITAVPEPSSMALLGIAGLGGFALRRMRRKGCCSVGESGSGV